MNKYFLPSDHPHSREVALSSLTKALLLVSRQAVTKTARSDDGDVNLILRAAVTPHTTANTAILAAVMKAFIAALRPVSAAAEVIARSLQLDFGGAYQLTVPSVSMPSAVWLSEDAVIPVLSGISKTGPTLSPHKLGVIVALTNEMVNSTNAEAIMRQLLLESVGPSLDAAMFSASAASGGQPAGILNGVAAIPASAATGAAGMALDLGLIAQALAGSAGGSTPIFIASPAQEMSMRVLSEQPLPVFASAAVAAGTVIGIVPAALSTVVELPQIDASATALDFANPPGGDFASSSPVYSMYQTDSIALRLRMPATWAMRSASAVAYLTGVKW